MGVVGGWGGGERGGEGEVQGSGDGVPPVQVYSCKRWPVLSKDGTQCVNVGTFKRGCRQAFTITRYAHLPAHPALLLSQLLTPMLVPCAPSWCPSLPENTWPQMAGRAGRRGLDAVGTVLLVAWEEPPPEGEVRGLLTGRGGALASQFRLTYNMILNLLRVEDLRVRRAGVGWKGGGVGREGTGCRGMDAAGGE